MTLPLLAASATGVSFVLDLSRPGRLAHPVGPRSPVDIDLDQDDLVAPVDASVVHAAWRRTPILLYPFSFLWVMAHAAPQGGVIPTAVDQI